MYNYQYVPKAKLKPVKNRVIELIHNVQNDVRDRFTFQYQFIGSEKRNMVTCDIKRNIGFDFDINLVVNDDDENYSPRDIKRILMNSFNKYTMHYGYDCCEDSTRVFTIKMKDTRNSRILHSCDFAIVNFYDDDQQEYIRFNKDRNYYSWEPQKGGFYQIPEKIEFCKDNKLWQEVRDLYIQKKNSNTNFCKKSRSIFAETIHEVCQHNGFYKE